MSRHQRRSGNRRNGRNVNNVANSSNRNERIEQVKKVGSKISIILNVLALIGAAYAIPQYNLAKKEHEVAVEEYNLTKEQLEREKKENEVQMQASYLICDLRQVDAAYNEYYEFHTIQDDISDLYNSIYRTFDSEPERVTNTLCVNEADYEVVDNTYYVTYLYVQSF
ncbi:hypothetical protein SAMN04487884_10892 [Butyrivibrio fibrisolvens]|uniref:Uncharacterized protein n=1 Tax=Butyrivibrio fibrisolvens TaxID=831 RepID=A0A1H9QRB0_BUTFI|nr:hypothetical protein [Butyrivibrio fibrisolvens]SER62988.1 hypothetical protein SAMN04487884_10892 [Butyrivibrio fibrisolvens]